MVDDRRNCVVCSQGEALDTWGIKGTGEGESMGDGESMGEEEEHGAGK